MLDDERQLLNLGRQLLNDERQRLDDERQWLYDKRQSPNLERRMLNHERQLLNDEREQPVANVLHTAALARRIRVAHTGFLPSGPEIYSTTGAHMPITTLDELFEHDLKDIYYAERRLLDSLDEMASEATDREAKKAFQQHRKETQGQIKRLERVFKSLGMKPEEQPCAGIEGLIKEKKSFMKEKPSEEILGFYNLHAAQKVERYEITAYEGLIEAAEHMELDDVVEQLTQTLEEEEATLNRLKQLASDYEVEQAGEEEEEEEEPVTGGRGRR